jgi:hypothetical protein
VIAREAQIKTGPLPFSIGPVDRKESWAKRIKAKAATQAEAAGQQESPMRGSQRSAPPFRAPLRR